ncbi:hypothetical protein B1R94_28325 [Mycolicibacterium litorale]|nr:hypothetical protein B1R94_28325 [Mycolicibacterium litorale]
MRSDEKSAGHGIPGAPRRSNRADVIATVVLLCAHAGFALYTVITSFFLVMATDACAYQTCGDERWVTRAIYLAIGGGALTVLLDAVLAVVLLAKQRLAFYVPLLGCAAQIAVSWAVLHMAALAGPIG